jgi:hypothetical protein
LDDDGERMIVCDGCGFWVHTRCNGVKDSDEEPTAGFACRACREAATAAAKPTAGEAAAGAEAAKQEEGRSAVGAEGGAAAGSKRAREGSAE